MEPALDLLAAPRPFQDLPPCPPAPNRPTGHPYRLRLHPGLRLRPPGEPTPTPPDHPAKPEAGPAILRLQISPRSALSSSQSSRISSRPWPLGTSRTSGGRSHPPWPRRPSRTAASTSGGFPWIGPRSPPLSRPLPHHWLGHPPRIQGDHPAFEGDRLQEGEGCLRRIPAPDHHLTQDPPHPVIQGGHPHPGRLPLPLAAPQNLLVQTNPFHIYGRQPTVQRFPQQRPIETAKQSPKRFQGGDPVARKRQVRGPPIGMRPGPPPHAPQRN
jgi:hypothetical protein